VVLGCDAVLGDWFWDVTLCLVSGLGRDAVFGEWFWDVMLCWVSGSGM